MAPPLLLGVGIGIGIGIDSCPRLLEGRQVYAKSLVVEAHGVALDTDTDATPTPIGQAERRIHRMFTIRDHSPL